MKITLINKIIQKLFARQKTCPIVFDYCQTFSGGFSLSGWYRLSDVQSVSLLRRGDPYHNYSIEAIERPDADLHAGEKTRGFSIECRTGDSIDLFDLLLTDPQGYQFALHIFLKKGELDVKLSESKVRKSVTETTRDKWATSAADLLIVCETALYLSGWALDQDFLPELVLARDAEKKFPPDKILRFCRQDVEQHFGASGIDAKNTGYVAKYSYPEISMLSISDDIKTVQVHLGNKEKPVEVKIDQFMFARDEPIRSLQTVLQAWPVRAIKQIDVELDFLKPLMLSAFPPGKWCDYEVKKFGEAYSQPKASIVVPLFKKYDFMRYQISRFYRDRSLDECELIYVVDDPEIKQGVEVLARELYQLYKIAFTVIFLDKNLGFAKANNLAVKNTSSEKIIFMNSDVLPVDRIWVDTLIDPLGASNAGLIGTRLFYEDDTIQHDGMAPMKLPDYGELIFNDHPGKGLSPQKNLPSLERCDLVTAACVAINKKVFAEIGGFDESYVLGDFEDSDICLKALSAGYKNYISRASWYYHLERQSQKLVDPGDWKHKVTIYNALVYNSRWGKVLAEKLATN